MTKKNKKIAVVGAGHNSLVCAAYLAKGWIFSMYLNHDQSWRNGLR